MKTKSILFGVFTALFLLVSAVSAVPHLINYEGQLYSSSGSPLTGDYTIVFKIYDVSAGGTSLWTETYDSTNKVHVQNGLFNVLLGSRTDLNLNFDKNYYLEISVNSEKLSPRQPLASVGYAYRTENATNAETLDNLDSLQLQRRVSGVCASGWAINTINENGTLVCAQITDTTYSAGAGLSLTGTTFSVNAAYSDDRYVNINGDTMTGILNMNNNKITNLASPGNPQDAATKGYVDSVSGGGDSDWVINGNNMYSNVSGNVGIGTPSPRVALDVMDSIQVDERGKNNGAINNGAASGNGIIFGSGGSGEGIISKRTAGGNQYGLDLMTVWISRVSITNGGNVGIGTTNPTAKLEVNGDVKFGCPSGMVKVGSFCMDQYEASVRQNADCTGTQYGASSDNYGWNNNGNDFAGYACSKSEVKPSACITWFQAQQACGNSGKRLCTNAEWQMAAAGTPDDCTSCPCSESSTQNTGSHSSCKSRWNVYDMNGNLWEWVADWSDPDTWSYRNAPPDYGSDYQYPYPTAFVRGGSWGDGGNSGVFALGMGTAPSDSGSGIGFRCCQ